MASALALVPAPRAVRTVRAARARSARGGLVVVAGKKGAWAKEFDPEYEKEKTVATVDDAKWPGLDKDKEKDPATYNILVKKTGPLNVTWNGVGVLQVPKGRDNAESNNVAKTVLIQRKEQVMAEVARLYPKMKGDLDFVIQMFEDPYADPVDMSQVPPEGMEAVPAEIKYMPKGKRYPF